MACLKRAEGGPEQGAAWRLSVTGRATRHQDLSLSDSPRYTMCRQASSEATSSRVCCAAGWAGRVPVAYMPEWVLASW